MKYIYVSKINSIKPNKLDDEYFIYVGRGNKYLKESVLHNSYSIKTYGRKRCLELYRIWLSEAIKAEQSEYQELIRLLGLAQKHHITLVCFCVDSEYPSDFIECHGQIIRNALIHLDKIAVPY